MYKAQTLDKVFTALTVVVVLSLLAWSFGLTAVINQANAAAITSAKDTIDDSDLSVLAKHILTFTTPNALAAAATLAVQFDPSGAAFSVTGTTATTTDFTASGMTIVTACGAGSDEVTVNVNNSTDTYTYTVCAGDTVSAGAKTLTIGASTKLVTNPSSASAYTVRLSTSGSDQADTMVAILDDVNVSATVLSSLTFTVAAVASGQVGANSEATNTSVTTTATSIPWGTLTADTAKVARQDLTVSTNATNGFVVTLWQDADLTSGTNDEIDKFRDDTDGAPQAWAAPAATLDTATTYGHMGVTSEDSTLGASCGTDTFGATLYDAVGTQASPIEVMCHTGPADGATADKGATKVGFKIEVDQLQEAANDYANVLTYIATPTF